MPINCHKQPVVNAIVSASTPPPPSRRNRVNYSPTAWSHDAIESLVSSKEMEEEKKLIEMIKKLRKEVVHMLSVRSSPMAALVMLVDVVERLGLSYLFEKEVKEVLDQLSMTVLGVPDQLHGDLHATALHFRLLRDHGYQISQDVFSKFLDANGKFKPCLLHQPMALLSLYEASFYAFEEEDTLDMARGFAAAGLKDFLLQGQGPYSDLPELFPLEKCKIEHGLELPLRWRMPRQHTRWFIDVYSEEPCRNSSLLLLAKLYFNRLQILHRNELVEVSRWWKKLDLVQMMPYIRDRVVEIFFIAMCMLPEPKFGYCRVRSTKLFIMIALIDDLYDEYGTVDELTLFTKTVERWDVNQIVKLPDYMKVVFFALFNDVNDMVYTTLKEKKIDVTQYLKNQWLALCQHFLVEAMWSKDGYVPRLEEYLINSRVSVSVPLIISYISALASEDSMLREALVLFTGESGFVNWNSIICRLGNDMATTVQEKRKGDVANAIECYMTHENVSEEEARLHIHGLISAAWTKVNKEQYNNTRFPRHTLDAAINLSRVVHFLYRCGDGLKFPSKYNEGQIVSLLLEKIS